jgi:formylglycine-generating enzyme required for sulfatase activity
MTMRRLTAAWALLGLGLAGGVSAAERPASPVERPAGTGVIVHSDGYVLTAHHVVAGARRIVVVTPGEFRAPASLVSTDQEHDLALLKVETVGLSEAHLGYAGAVRLDQEVIAVGFQFGLKEVSVTRGRIAAVRSKGVQRVFQVDAAINPGNSGGPVFNAEGEVVGILTTKFSHPSGIVPEGMAFAVPISYATPLLANIPDFDFTSLGKGRKAGKAKGNGGLAQELARTSVRIETVRAAEGSPSTTGPGPSTASQPKGDPQPSQVARMHPGASQADGAPPLDDASAEKVNEQLKTAQREALERLAQRGATVSEGMMALIPAGEFVMGSEDLLPDARPVHRVFVSSFWIDRYQVTNAQYRKCVEAGGCLPPKDRQAFDDTDRAQHPVTNVTWAQARTYCQWKGKRLPTEAEWEKAARGTDGRRYPWGNSNDVIKARLKSGEIRTASNGTEPVGSQSAIASPYGVYDLVGSVSEWVKDWYGEEFYQVSPSHDPQGPVRGSFRVLRGGPLSERPLEAHVSYRSWDEMTYWGPTLGFRCADDVS